MAPEQPSHFVLKSLLDRAKGMVTSQSIDRNSFAFLAQSARSELPQSQAKSVQETAAGGRWGHHGLETVLA